MPKRLGPEWWACYGAAFALGFQDMLEAVRENNGDVGRLWDKDHPSSLGSSIAERAADVADRALECFAEAVEGGCIEVVE